MQTIKTIYNQTLIFVSLISLAACGSDQAGETADIPEVEVAVESNQIEIQAVTPLAPSLVEREERERNKAIVADYMAILGDPEAEKEFLADNYKLVRSEFHNLSYNAAGSELEAMSTPLKTAFPDHSVEVIELIGEGSTVVVQYQIRGTHQANFFGIPATGKSIDVESVAIFELADGKIYDSWFMSDEVRLLTQLGTIMPARADGKIIVPPANVATRTGDEYLAENLAIPIDSQEYRNKIKVNAYKAKNAPDGLFERKENGRPYNTYVRRGFLHLNEFADDAARSEFPMGGAFPDREDRIATLIADGDKVVIRFLLTATNTGSLFGLPPSNNPVGGWEVGIMTFNDDDWDLGWWFGDDLGMLTQVGGTPDYFAVKEPMQ